MQDAEAYIPNEQSLDVVDGKSRPEAMSEVFAQRLRSFYRTAYRFLGNTADAEDAVQDALLSAYKHMHEFRGESQLSTWLTVIVKNRARMQLRSRSRCLHVSIDEPIGKDQQLPPSERLSDGRPSPEDEYREAQLKTQLRRFAGRLSPTLRRTFQLRDMEGLSIREAADIMDVPPGTVKAQLSRARAKLTRSIRRALGNPVPQNGRQSARSDRSNGVNTVRESRVSGTNRE
jgi:RNA polymerase sigma-70 factor (ECF subfamily)